LAIDYVAYSSLDYQCKPLVSREGATPIPLCRIPTDEGGMLFKMRCREARPSTSIFFSEKLPHLPRLWDEGSGSGTLLDHFLVEAAEWPGASFHQDSRKEFRVTMIAI